MLAEVRARCLEGCSARRARQRRIVWTAERGQWCARGGLRLGIVEPVPVVVDGGGEHALGGERIHPMRGAALAKDSIEDRG